MVPGGWVSLAATNNIEHRLGTVREPIAGRYAERRYLDEISPADSMAIEAAAKELPSNIHGFDQLAGLAGRTPKPWLDRQNSAKAWARSSGVT